MVRLIGVGDIVAPHASRAHFEHARAVLRAADITFGNCESVFSEVGEPNPVLFLHARLGDPAGAAVLHDAGFDVLSFANNLCLSQGYRAFFRTIELLRDAGLAPVGVGGTIGDAVRPVYAERDGTKVAFLACSSILLPGTNAGPQTPGCAPLRAHTLYENASIGHPGMPPRLRTWTDVDDLELLCHNIRAARQSADVVVVSCHWGLMNVRAAIADYQRQAAHAMIDSGADLIFGHHAHILKGIEVYRGGTIFYSLGDFVFDQPRVAPVSRDAYKTIVASVTIENGRVSHVGFLPCHPDAEGHPRVLGPDDPMFGEIFEYLRAISAEADLACSLSEEAGEILVSP